MFGIFVKWKRAAVLSEIDASFRLSFLILSTEPEVFDCALFQSALVIKYNLHFCTDGFYRESGTISPPFIRFKVAVNGRQSKRWLLFIQCITEYHRVYVQSSNTKPSLSFKQNDTPPSSR